MKEWLVKFLSSLNYNQVLMTFMAIVFSVVVLIMATGFMLDKMNIKSFSFKTGFVFYQDEDTKQFPQFQRPTHPCCQSD